MIDADELVLRARALLTSQDSAAKLPETDIFAAIPAALAEWKQSFGANRKIIATTGAIAVTNGTAQIKQAIEAVGIYPEKVSRTKIYLSYDGNPELSVRFVNSRDRLRLTGNLDHFFVSAYFDGEIMEFAEVFGEVLNGISFRITAEANPTSCAVMPADCIGEVVLCLANVVRRFNTDSEHKGILKRLQQK